LPQDASLTPEDECLDCGYKNEPGSQNDDGITPLCSVGRRCRDCLLLLG
jgi:hypothetical protein